MNKLEKEMFKDNLNEAIFTVLTTQYKKDAKDAFNLVDEAGYKYIKYRGRFEVYNPETNRRIYVTEGFRKNYYTVHTGLYMRQTTHFKREADIKVMDFVNCLEKPVNTEFYREVPEGKAAGIYYNRIKSKRNMVKSYEDDIKSYQEQIEKLQQKIIYAAQKKAEYEMNIREAKKELGIH